MKTRELTAYTRKLIKGRRREILLICLLPMGTEILLRTAEAALYCLMLYFGNIKSVELFTGENTEQAVIAALFFLLRIFVMPPLWCGLAARLMMFAEGKQESLTFSDMLLSGKFIVRSVSAGIFVRIISAALLLPCVFSAVYGFGILSDGADDREIFIAVGLFSLSIFLGIFWAIVRIGLTAVPFLLHKYSGISAFRVVLRSLAFMNGRRKLPFLLAVMYLPLVLTVFAAPYFIPEWAAAYGVGVSIFFKEDESAHEQACIYRRHGRTKTAEKLSPWKLRCIGRINPPSESHRGYHPQRRSSTDC